MNRSIFFKLMFHGTINCFLQAGHVIAKRDPDAGPKRQTNRGMTVVILIVVSVFFLTGLVFLFIRKCTSFLNRRGGILHISESMPPRVGLDPALVKTFPTFLYSEVKEHKIEKATLECSVCLLEFEDHEILRLLPKCSHVFHLKCIDAWLAIHDTCPVCRANLVPKPAGDLTPQGPRDSGGNISESNALLRNGVSGSNVTNDLMVDMNNTTTPEVINKSNDPNRPPRSTLMLPEDVRSQLMMKSSSGSREFQSGRSPKDGYTQ